MSKVRTICCLLGLCICIAACISVIADNKTAKTFQEQYKEDTDKIVSKLSDDNTWKDANYAKDKTKAEDLLKHLKLAAVFKCEELQEKLIKYIAYTPFDLETAGRTKTPEELYPAYYTMCHMGRKSATQLINYLKTADPKQTPDKEQIIQKSRNLALNSLVAIYDQGGYGKDIVSHRLNLELEKITDKEKMLLQDTMQYLPAVTEIEIADLVLPKQYKEAVSEVTAKLADPETWKDAIYKKDKPKTEILLKHIKTASMIENEKLMGMLVSHLDHDIYKGIQEKKKRPIRIKCPAYGALCAIGFKAVEPLIELIKTTSPDQRRHRLAIFCLTDIYKQAGFGKEMVNRRLVLEVSSVVGKEKEFLEKAMQHPTLKD